MMTSNFPLLKLPLIPLEPIINQLDFLDLVRLSMKSSKFKRRLELLKLSVCSLQLFVTERFYEIAILRNRSFFYINVCDSVPVNTIAELANIQGEPVHIWKHSRDKMRVKSDLSKLATLETITKHILSITKVASYCLKYGDAQTEIRNLFIWQITTRLEWADIGIRVTMSPEDLTFILDGISINCLYLNVRCPGFKYQRSIRHPEIHISRPRWIDFDQFSLGPETIEASFSGQKVSVTVLNRLIKDWATGRNKALKQVHFAWDDNDPESLAMAREHRTRPPKLVLPNRNVEHLKGLSINYSIKYQFRRQSVYYEVRLSVEEYLGLNGIHLKDQV